VTGEKENFFPALSDDLDSEQVYAILIVYVLIWIVLGIGCGIYLIARRNRARSN
jgi:hypothetical protein